MNNLGMSPIIENDSKISVEIKCNIEGDLSNLFLIFSTDNAHSWYSVKMKNLGKLYSITLPNVPFGNKILYLFKIISFDGKEYIEDNDGKYYFEIAGQKEVIGDDKSTHLQNINSEEDLSKVVEKITIEEAIIENVVNNLISGDETTIVHSPILNQQNINTEKKSINTDQNRIETLENTLSLESSSKVRPIIPYNPFSADYGDLESSKNALLSFSQIIDGRLTSPPKKKNSYLKNIQVLETNKKCDVCKANLSNKWKICPICGSKN